MLSFFLAICLLYPKCNRYRILLSFRTKFDQMRCLCESEWVCVFPLIQYTYYTQLRYIQKLSHSICHIILTKFTRCTGLRLPTKSKKKHNAHTHRRKLQSMIRTKQTHAHSLTHIHIHRQWTRDGQKNRRFAQARPTFPHYECWKIQC